MKSANERSDPEEAHIRLVFYMRALGRFNNKVL
jgi:hypothetical protein